MNQIETVYIEGVGPYGVRVNGGWYGIGKQAPFGPDSFQKGQTVTVGVATAQSGKKYINEIHNGANNAIAAPGPSPVPPRSAPPPVVASAPRQGYSSNDPDLQERIARNTAYQKATDSVSRLLTPFVAKEEDILPKLKLYVEDMAGWLYGRIKNDPVAA